MPKNPENERRRERGEKKIIYQASKVQEKEIIAPWEVEEEENNDR